MDESSRPESVGDRRGFLQGAVRGIALTACGVTLGLMAGRAQAAKTVWQIDPFKCTMCGRCAVDCVLSPSAVKCVHSYGMCGYCELCTGFFEPDAPNLHEGAENQLCPTGAIERTLIEQPYFEYSIIEDKCIGCAKCVAGCAAFGNGSMYLQIRHDLCVGCNDCAIARACPTQAISRVPADQPYLLKQVNDP